MQLKIQKKTNFFLFPLEPRTKTGTFSIYVYLVELPTSTLSWNRVPSVLYSDLDIPKTRSMPSLKLLGKYSQEKQDSKLKNGHRTSLRAVTACKTITLWTSAKQNGGWEQEGEGCSAPQTER